jgi:Tol biopolymer transport system component
MNKMKSMSVIVFLGVLVLVVLASSLRSQQSAAEMFEKALYTEEAQGDLQKAIGLYKQILDRFPDSREVAAKSLLHIGMCYEKLGKEEAQGAYQKILQDYADQVAIAKDARARLVSLTTPGPAAAGHAAEAAKGFTFRRLDFPEIGNSHQARLSPDGKHLLYIRVRDKEPRFAISVLELSSGRSRVLVNDVDYGANLIFAWSPDGKTIVYKKGRDELRLISTDGGESSTLWSASDPETAVYPLDWSAPNRSVLVALVNAREKSVRLAMLPETGGELRIIVSGDQNELADLGRVSPDGKFIVGMKRKEKNTDIYVWTVDGGRETRITDHVAEDYYPFWSADGKFIVFVSDRSKVEDLWAVPMAGADAAGEPIRIQANLGKNRVPTDLTPSGALTFYVTSPLARPSDLFVLPVDPKTGEARGQFRPFAKFPADGMFARWSPDGKWIAYTSRKGNIQLPNAYVSAGGDSEEIEIPARGYWIGNVEWARDGKHLLFPGWSNDDRRVGIFRISLEDRTIKPVQPPGEPYGTNGKGAYINLRWLPLAGQFMLGRLGDNDVEIYTMDPTGSKLELAAAKTGTSGWNIPSPDGCYVIGIVYGEKKIILLSLKDGTNRFLCNLPPEGWPMFAWSPDGSQFVWNEGRQLKIQSVSDGTTRVLVDAGEAKKIVGGLAGTPNTAWSPDGTKIAYIVRDSAAESSAPSELWVVEIAGGATRKIAVAPASHPELTNVVWHPSGLMILANGNSGAKTAWEHWVMENFLPGRDKK